MRFGRGGHARLSTGRRMQFGDSITAGSNTPSQNGWRVVVNDGLTAAGIDSYPVGLVAGTGTLSSPWNRHDGYPSHTIAQLTALVPGRLAATGADLVMVHAGTVDCASGSSVASMISDLSAMIDLLSGDENRRIVLAQIIPQGPPSGGSPSLVVNYNAAMVPLVAAKRALGYRIVLVDMWTGFDLTAWSTDGVHPTSEDAPEFMGPRWVDGIADVLKLD